MKLLRYNVLIIWYLAILFPLHAFAVPVTTTQISNTNYLPESPQINNNGQIVWSGSDGKNYNIYLFSNGVVTKISNNDFDNREPQINDNGQIAWKGYTAGSYNTIFLYDGGQITQVADSIYNNITFQLNSAGQIAWSGNYGDNGYKIYLFSNGITTQITNNTIDDRNAKLNTNGQIVWQSYNGFNYEIYLYNNGKISQITNNDLNNINPSINDTGQIVWEMVGNTNTDIMLYDGNSISKLTNNNYYNKNPKINNNGKIIWETYLDGAVDLYCYDNYTAQRINTATLFNLYSKINDKGEIVWLGYDGSNVGIYRYFNTTVENIVSLGTPSFAQHIFYNSGASDLNAGAILSERFNSGMQIRNINDFKSYPSTTGGIQEAIDSLPVEGGIVYIPAGTYILKSTICLRSHIHLVGDGSSTIIKAVNETNSLLASDANYGDKTIIVENSSGFEVGMSILMCQYNSDGSFYANPNKIIAIHGNTLTLEFGVSQSQGSTQGFSVTNNAVVVNAFPLIWSYYSHSMDDVSIENMSIDGNKDNVRLYGSWLQYYQVNILLSTTTNTLIRNNWIINANGCGIETSGQFDNLLTANDKIINNTIIGSALMAMHLGGNKYLTIANNKIINNAEGIYFCWGVQNSILNHNLISGNTLIGIHGVDNAGVLDMLNIIQNNLIDDNGEQGIYANNTIKNTFNNNIIINNSHILYGSSGLFLGSVESFEIYNNIITDIQDQATQKGSVYYYGNSNMNNICDNNNYSNINLSPIGVNDIIINNQSIIKTLTKELIILLNAAHYMNYPQINNNGQIISYDSNGNFMNLYLIDSVPPPDYKYIIMSAGGTGGRISPSGSVYATLQSDKTFTMIPDPGYQVVDVLIDGISNGPLTSYTFKNVKTDHTITASYTRASSTITSSAGTGGAIDPSGAVILNSSSSQAFNIMPYPNYHLDDVLVDGTSVGAVNSYTFYNVTEEHTIAASFAINTQTITATAGDHGTIAPSGSVTVNHGGDQTFRFNSATGYHVADVKVDGSSVGAVSSYTFNNVTADRTIAVTFAIDTKTITASAGANGTISPSGVVSVNYGADQEFDFIPTANYHMASVTVDGTPLNAPLPASYTFTNVTGPHTIAVTFAIDTNIITASAGDNGTITPSGSVPVEYGGSQTFNISPNTNHIIKEVLVDGQSVGPVASFAFNDVIAGHTITANFVSAIQILTDKDSLKVTRGRTASLQIKLSEAPLNDVIVAVIWENGSQAISVQGATSLTFTASNWDTYQTVNFMATADSNELNGTALFNLSGPGLIGKQITVTKVGVGMDISALFLLLDN